MMDQDFSKMKVRTINFFGIYKRFMILFIFENMKVAELRDALKAKGLNTTGNKQDLIERLQAASGK